MSNISTTFKVHRKEKPFTMVDNELINNSKVSWAAKGVLIYILSKPPQWKIYKQDIVNHAPNGVASVKTIIKELKKIGYITLAKVLDSKARIVEWRYNVFESPVEKPIENHYVIKIDESGIESEILPDENPEVENQPVDNSSPEVDFPSVETPPVENRPTSNTKYNNTDSSHTQSNQENRLSKKEYIKAIKKQIDFDTWEKSAQKQDKADIEAIIIYMADLCFSQRSEIKINKQLLDTSIVRNEFLNISLETLLQVLCIYQSQGNISKPRAYIWTCVYNQIHNKDELDNYVPYTTNNYDGSHEPPSYDLDELSKRGMYMPIIYDDSPSYDIVELIKRGMNIPEI